MTTWTWGKANPARSVICVHGLSRNGRDFDALAGTLADDGCFVACPDIVGRGASDRLADPAGYSYPQYMADATALFGQLGAPAVDWVGTSMGGILGMLLAAQKQHPLRCLVINDVGPFIPKAALERIAGYVGLDPHFPDFEAALSYTRRVCASFGDLTPAQWETFTRHSIVEDPAGGYRQAYDPAIAAVFKTGPIEDVDLWAVWDQITIPVLVLRGAQSDILLAETAEEMTRRGPKAKLVELPDCGHAPALLGAWEIGLIRDWLNEVRDLS